MAGQWGAFGTAVGLGRGDGSDDNLTLGRTKEEERRGTTPVSFEKSLYRDGGEGEAGGRGLPGAPHPLRSSPSGTHSKHSLTLGNQSWAQACRLQEALRQLNQDLVTFQAKWVPWSPPSTRQASLVLEGPDHHDFPSLPAAHQLPDLQQTVSFADNLLVVVSTVGLLFPRLAPTYS